MAQKYIVRCKDTTETAGTGTLTLRNSTSANWQTPAQAVTRTLLANGDTVRYTISDTSNPVLFEEGIGTIGSAGLTLTRDTVRQSSSGTSKISWPSGGARDVVISWSPGDTALISNQGSDYTAATFATNLGLPRLATENTFTLNQTISRSIGATLILKRDAASVGVAGDLLCQGLNASSSVKSFVRIRGAAVDITAGSEDGRVQFLLMQNGTADVERLRLDSDGTLTAQPSGNKYVAFQGGDVVKQLFGSAIPLGWNVAYETNSAVIRLAKSSDTIGATGGGDDIFDGAWATAAHALTVAELAVHAHGPNGGFGSDRFMTLISTSGSSQYSTAAGSTGPNTETQTANAGSGNPHSHDLTTPYYRIAAWGTFA